MLELLTRRWSFSHNCQYGKRFEGFTAYSYCKSSLVGPYRRGGFSWEQREAGNGTIPDLPARLSLRSGATAATPSKEEDSWPKEPCCRAMAVPRTGHFIPKAFSTMRGFRSGSASRIRLGPRRLGVGREHELDAGEALDTVARATRLSASVTPIFRGSYPGKRIKADTGYVFG